jgi:hypothetical protein
MSPTTSSTYRYERFRLHHMLADLRFAPTSPGPGNRVPPLDLHTVDGGPVRLGELDRPHLLVFGSNTCPMTASAAAPLIRLHRRFGHAVRFVLVQVREAHPGAHLPQPTTAGAKSAHARRLRDSLGVDFTVAVDDLDGQLHTTLDVKPNAAYLVDSDGTIVFRSLWASDERGLQQALEAVSEDRRPPRVESRRMLGPMLRAIGHIDPVLRCAGPGATRDLARSAPPMLLAARVAALFRGQPRERRGHALVASIGVGVLGVILAMLLLV